MIRKAMILAAGMGSRLGNITRDKPKALVEVHGIPLLGIILEKLIRQGFNNIVINVHHYGEMIKDYIEKHPHDEVVIRLSEEKEKPLETGGGIKYARKLLAEEDSFLIHNVDILSDMDLRELALRHEATGDLVTLAVSSRSTTRYLLADENDLLCGWENTATGERVITREPQGDLRRWGYSGVAVMRRKVLTLLPDDEIFSLTPFFLELSKEQNVKVYAPGLTYWYDVGKPGIIALAEREICKEKLM